MPGSRTGIASRRGFSLLEILIALVLVTGAMVTLLYLTRVQAAAELAARERLAVLTKANQLMGHWLSDPTAEPGVYEGKDAEGRTWVVSVFEEEGLPMEDVLEDDEAAPPEEGEASDETRQVAEAAVAGGRLRAAQMTARLLTVQVCCTWLQDRAQKRLCLDSARLALPAEELE